MGIDATLIAVWVLGVVLSQRLFRDIFTPLCIYVSVWCACLLLFRLRLIAYDPLEARTWLLIFGGMASFGAGCWLASLKLGRPRNCPRQRRASQPAFRAAVLVLLVLAATGIILFAARMASIYGFSTYFSDPSVIRADAPTWTRMGALGALVLLCYPLFVCSLIDIFATRKVRWFTCVGLVIPVAETYLLTDRGTLIGYMICSFFVWVYHSKRRRPDSKAVLLVSAGVVCGLIYFLAVGGLYDKLIEITSPAAEYTTFVPQSGTELRLLTPYVYATGAFPTFQAAMNDVQMKSWGTQSFYPLARVLHKVGILERQPVAADFTFYLVPVPFNNCTWLFAFYTDFGACGVLLLPLVVGWGETRLYVRMKESPTIFSVAGSAALAAATALTPFGFVQYDFILWYFLVAMLLVSEFAILNGRRLPAVRHARTPGWITTPRRASLVGQQRHASLRRPAWL